MKRNLIDKYERLGDSNEQRVYNHIEYFLTVELCRKLKGVLTLKK